MKKEVLLIITLSGLWLKGFTQSGSLGQFYYVGAGRPLYMVPVIGYHTTGNWYIEGRYNYETINSASVYFGKTIKKKALISYSITPIAGLVAGRFNGGSIGVNAELDYKKFYFSSQSQYTFSIENKATNFTYSWSDLTYRLKTWVSAGVSLQQTNLYKATGTFEKGILIKAEYKFFSFPLYIFNPLTNNRYFVLGLDIEWEHKKNTGNSSSSAYTKMTDL
jgi:hypothetical protein